MYKDMEAAVANVVNVAVKHQTGLHSGRLSYRGLKEQPTLIIIAHGPLADRLFHAVKGVYDLMWEVKAWRQRAG